MIFDRNKRGELTTKQLVTIIILITSFIIILFLLFRLNLGETSDKEICHNSVVLKEKSGVLTGSLDCRTSYLCISGGKNCEEISASSTIKVDHDNKSEIMGVIADEMSDCWWMFGEGEVNYGGGSLATSVHCAICSIVTFDEKIQEQIPEITYSEFYDYLKTTAKTKTQTYLQYLYGADNIDNIEDKEYFNVDLITGGINTEERQTIITGIDMNVKVLFVGNKDKYLNTFIISSSETSLTECKEYLTKA
ncbi:MAG TPA: hypothetical protein VMV95_04085 [Bacillota bacterium]|nr:hypothetical protein [Candidatus Paceibacterota bacterium]HUW44111.1 hypothetical protein [Bacillota bacterium]